MNKHFLLNKKTIEDSIYTEGIGIHSGDSIKMRFLPANKNTGIVFINKRYGMKSPIRSSPESVSDTTYAITLSNNKWQIQTVEHLLSVFYILGITDIIIETCGNEIPIFDGSSLPIINLFNEKKFYLFEEINNPIKIINPIWIINGDKFIIALPSKVPSISYTISYNHPILHSQYANFTISKDTYIKEIAKARTFGFEKDVEFLRMSSYARGGSLKNALVLSESSYLNKPRFSNECVRHKIMDFIGDIALIGKPILGKFIVCKSGHTLDFSFIKKIINIYSNIDVGEKIDFQRKVRKKI